MYLPDFGSILLRDLEGRSAVIREETRVIPREETREETGEQIITLVQVVSSLLLKEMAMRL